MTLRSTPSRLAALLWRVESRHGKASFSRLLTRSLQVNVLTVLDAVPRMRWRLDRWIDTEDSARSDVTDMRTPLCGNGLPQSAVDGLLADGRDVFIQFAWMECGEVDALSGKLEMPGWCVPPEDQTVNAASLNHVRYMDSGNDGQEAKLLGVNHRALGSSGFKAVKSAVNPKSPERWIRI